MRPARPRRPRPTTTSFARDRCRCGDLAADSASRAILINTGNANAGTGEDGLVRALSTCIALARKLEISPQQVLPFSTGVIMEPLPIRRLIEALPAAFFVN